MPLGHQRQRTIISDAIKRNSFRAGLRIFPSTPEDSCDKDNDKKVNQTLSDVTTLSESAETRPVNCATTPASEFSLSTPEDIRDKDSDAL